MLTLYTSKLSSAENKILDMSIFTFLTCYLHCNTILDLSMSGASADAIDKNNYKQQNSRKHSFVGRSEYAQLTTIFFSSSLPPFSSLPAYHHFVLFQLTTILFSSSLPPFSSLPACHHFLLNLRILFNSLPNDKFLDMIKLKAFAGTN